MVGKVAPATGRTAVLRRLSNKSNLETNTRHGLDQTATAEPKRTSDVFHLGSGEKELDWNAEDPLVQSFSKTIILVKYIAAVSSI